jgi:hypothetical protein
MIPKRIAEFFGKKNEAKPHGIATLTITMDVETGDMRVVGNVIKDTKLCLMMLVEAGHTLVNKQAEAELVPPILHEAPAVTH